MRNKGITLVALIVTIIMLLILAGISIAALIGEHGIISQAQRAKEAAKISELQEKLEIKKIEYQADQSRYDIGVEEYIEYIISQGVITNEDITETGEANSKYITLEDKYVFLVEKLEETKEIKITYQGTVGKVKPIITGIEVLSKTTNAIKVQVNTRLTKDVTYKYYIAKENEEYGKEIIEAKDKVYEYQGLEQNETYKIKVEVIEKEGGVAEEEITVTLGQVEELTQSNTTFTNNPNNWTNGNVEVTIETSITGFTLQYKTEKTGESGEVSSWTNYTGPITITRNQSIYARAIDSTGQSNGYATGVVEKIDKEKPTIGTVTGSTTTGNIGTVAATNIADTGGSGIVGYYVSTTNSTPAATASGWITLLGSSFAWNTTVNGTYYVWVKDEAGNVSEMKNCTVSGLVSKVTITAYNNLTIVAGNTGTPTLTYTGTPKTKSFTSSNTSVATINASTGAVTGVAAGTATMTVTLTNYDGTTINKTCTITVQTAVAKVETVNYASIADAISAISSSGTVTMLVNRTENSTIPAGKTITLALNSKTITGYIINNGTLSVSGGTITNTTTYGIYNNVSGTLTTSANITTSASSAIINYNKTTITGGTLNCAANAVTVANHKTLTISGGSIKSQNSWAVATGETESLISQYSTTITGGDIKGVGGVYIYGTLNMTDGIITSYSKFALSLHKNTATISGGIVQSSGSYPIVIAANTSVTISNATIRKTSPGNSAILCGKGGTVTINSGNIYDYLNGTENSNTILAEGTVNIKGGTITCQSSYAASEAIDIQGGGVVNISGGTVQNTKGGRAIEVGDNDNGNGTLKVTGGTVSATSIEKAYATVRVNDGNGNFTFTKGTIKNTNSSGYCYYKNSTTYKTGTWTK